MAEFYDLPEDVVADEIEAYRIEQGLCPQCGGDRDVCGDAERDWWPVFNTCEVTMARAGARNLYEAQHRDAPFHDGRRTSWAKEASPDTPFHWSDGLTIALSPVEVGEDVSWHLIAQESPSDEDEATE